MKAKDHIGTSVFIVDNNVHYGKPIMNRRVITSAYQDSESNKIICVTKLGRHAYWFYYNEGKYESPNSRVSISTCGQHFYETMLAYTKVDLKTQEDILKRTKRQIRSYKDSIVSYETTLKEIKDGNRCKKV
jgi:hypothetical protein